MATTRRHGTKQLKKLGRITTTTMRDDDGARGDAEDARYVRHRRDNEGQRRI
jgi:hypothetical protein